MSTGRKIAAVIALLGWITIFGTCVVGVATTERVSDEDAVYVTIENGTSRTFRNVLLGGNYKTSEFIRKQFEPGARTREYKRGLTVGSYSSIHIKFVPKGYANVRGIGELTPGKYLIKLVDGPVDTQLNAEVSPAE